jgi:predicted metal-binding membrane protein
MNLVWMGLATLLMTLEKLPRLGPLVTTPLGVTLVAAGALTLVFTSAPPGV